MSKLKHDILNDVVMDDEFMEIVEKHKERQLTDVEKEVKIQADKVIYVINRTLAKLSMMAHLPYFLDDEERLLKQHVKTKELAFVLDLLAKYGARCGRQNSYCSVLEEYSNILEGVADKIMPVPITSESPAIPATADPNAVVDPHIAQLIDIIFYNKCLRIAVYSDEEENKRADRNMMKIIKAMTDFKNVARMKLYTTGEEEAELDKQLRMAYNANISLKTSIEELKGTLEKQRKELGEQLNKKLGVYEMYSRKMEKVRKDFQEQIKKTLFDSEEIMMQKTVDSEAKQVFLAEEARSITNEYDLLLADDLKQEKQSRSRRYKIETQLQNWLIKFDQDMGERQAEYEALKKEFDDEKEAMEELQHKFDEQEDEYVILMAEKTEEEDRIYNEIAYQFLLNRSARKIQRWWRAYKERKLARRKARKGKGKGGKGKKGKKEKEAVKPESSEVRTTREDDPNLLLLEKNKKFKADVFEDLQDPNAFDKKDVVVEL